MTYHEDCIQDLNHHLSSASGVLIVTHQNPDVDAIGSSLAWQEVLYQQGIQSYIWCDDISYKFFNFLDNHRNVKRAIPDKSKYDTLLVLDASHLKRVKNLDRLNLSLDRMTVVNIDHHPDNSLFGNINYVKNCSSVGEYSTELFEKMRWEINEVVANALYAAVLFDTGCFLNTNVTKETYQTMSLLLEKGADHNVIVEKMFESHDPQSFETFTLALKNKVIRKGAYAYSFLPEDISEGRLKVIEFLRKIEKIHVVLMFKALEKGGIKISLRSKTSFDVSKFSQQFGGGGHHRASGILMQGTLEETIETVIKQLEKDLTDPLFFRENDV